MRLEVWACACALFLACTSDSEAPGPTGTQGSGTNYDASAAPVLGDAGSTGGTAGGGNSVPDAGGSSVGIPMMDGSVALGNDASADSGPLGASDAATDGSLAADATMSADGGDLTDGAMPPDAQTLATIPGCGDSTLLALPEDPTQRGAWPVGQKTVSIGRLSAVEVFYPATPGSEQGKDELTYDMRQFLPKSEQMKVPDAEATIGKAGTYRDLPLDTEHGPYPVVIFVHGTASFRLGSWHTQALWASRGFVVVAADHPGLYLADYLATNGCGQSAPPEDLSGDMDDEIAALTAASGDLAFLKDHVDMQRVGLSGHSAGAYAIAPASTKPGVQVVMPLAGTQAVAKSSTLKSVLFVGGIDDQVLAYKSGDMKLGNWAYPGTDQDAYNGSPGPSAVKKRIVGITHGGHLNVTDLCFKNAQNKDDIAVATAHNVCGVSSITNLGLNDCGSIDPLKGLMITNAATTAVLEETLQCQDRGALISNLKQTYSDIGDFKEAK